jgi:DNA polymerase III gamma/tau subunit
MRFFVTAGAALLSFGLAIAPLTYGQDQKPEEPKPEMKPAEKAPKPIPPATQPAQEQHPERNDHAQQQQPQQDKQQKQEVKQQEQDQKHAQQDQKKAQEEQQKQAEQNQKQQEKLQKEQGQQAKQNQQERPARSGSEAAQARPANVRGGGGRIPEEKFRANFGREHHFHISRPVVVEGAPRFQYAGFWFVLMDPWPADWAYSDDMYIDDIDGMYYLCDPVHPGVQIAISVVM